MVSIKNALLVTDMDGTLLKADKTVSEKNIRALQDWVAHGGKFTIATGRSIRSAGNHLEELPVNCPAVLFNGSVVYDYDQKKTCYVKFLPERYREIAQYVYDHFPEVGIELMVEDGIWITRYNDVINCHLKAEHLPHQDCPQGWFPEQVVKILFGVPVEQAEAFYQHINPKIPMGMYCLLTDEAYCEVLLEGVTKAVGLKELQKAWAQERFTICLGDYFNDLEMIQQADIGVATANALPEVKEIAQMVTTSNEEDAIAITILRLIEQKIIHVDKGE